MILKCAKETKCKGGEGLLKLLSVEINLDGKCMAINALMSKIFNTFPVKTG